MGRACSTNAGGAVKKVFEATPVWINIKRMVQEKMDVECGEELTKLKIRIFRREGVGVRELYWRLEVSSSCSVKE